jgi:hypothetical protein
VGHDQISGSQGLALAREVFRCPYLHIIHSSPAAVELYKDTDARRDEGMIDYVKSSTKEDTQNELAALADVVLAVGPKLTRHVKTMLVGVESADKVLEVLPGLNSDLLSFRKPRDTDLDHYCLLSGRLHETLIKGIDLFIQIAGQFQTRSLGASMRGTTFIMRGFDKEKMNPHVAGLQRRYGVKPDNILARPFITDERQLLQELKSASMF